MDVISHDMIDKDYETEQWKKKSQRARELRDNKRPLDDKERQINKKINYVIHKTESSQINEHYMLFLFKSYQFDMGVEECCIKHESLTTELINYYIRKRKSEKVLEVCKEQNSEDSSDLWIQALCYFRDEQDSKK